MSNTEISTLQVMDKMVKEDNKGIALSSILVNATQVPQGIVVGFGLEEKIGKDAQLQTMGLPGEYMFMCFAVKRIDFEQTKAKLIEDNLKLWR